MTARLSQRLVDEVRARVDIVDVVAEHVPLRRSGKRLVGLCPFHSEKTPSFSVSRERQLFYCFGCQTGGDVFRFLMLRERASFGEVLERLARRVGLDPQAYAASPQERRRLAEREALLAAQEAAAAYYRRCLSGPEGAGPRAYLEGRGIGPDLVETFGLGYAPAGGGELRQELARSGVDERAALRAGLLVAGSRGREPYPRFRDRIMFPIRDPRGRVVGFGGRQWREGPGPKYLNSPESPLFQKGRLLYGLPWAEGALGRSGRAVLVEGYTDVIGLHGVGVQEALASLGTAFTPEQAALLRRYVEEVVLAFDADPSGQAAARRGLEVLREAGLRVRVLVLPEGDDPDSFVRRRGGGAFQEALAGAVPLTEYLLRQVTAGCGEGIEARAEAVRRAVPILLGVDSLVEREGYVRWLAEGLGVSEAAVQGEIARAAGSAGRRGRPGHHFPRNPHTNKGFGPAASEPQTEGRPGTRHAGRAVPSRAEVAARSLRVAERVLVREMLKGPAAMDKVLALAGPEPVQDPVLARVVGHLQRLQAEGPYGPKDVLEAVSEPEVAAAIGELLEEAVPVGLTLEACAERVRRQRLRASLRRLEQALLGRETGGDAVLEDLVLEYKWVRDAVRREWTSSQAGLAKTRRP